MVVDVVVVVVVGGCAWSFVNGRRCRRGIRCDEPDLGYIGRQAFCIVLVDLVLFMEDVA